MLVKLLEGRMAGEVVDMPYHRAAPLLEQKRVIDVRQLQVETAAAESRQEQPAKNRKRNMNHADTRPH
jgi:hypothetical protein